jgi:4-hydroxy-2-oxoglutarate aldolase
VLFRSVLLYNVPAFTGIDFVPAIFMDLAQHPQIVGVKDSSSNVVKMAGVLAAYPDFQVFAGTGSALLPFLSLGAVGGIMGLANVTSEPLRAIVDAFHAGDMATARRHQLSVAALNEAVTARYGVAGLKYAMDRVGIYGGPVRRPLLPLSAAGRADIDRLLTALGLGIS